MNWLSDDLVLQVRFAPNLFATCARYRDLVPFDVRKWFIEQPQDVWPTTPHQINILLDQAGNDWNVYRARRVTRFVTHAFENGRVDAAVWILKFGVGIQGPHHQVAPPDLHDWLTEIGCKKWPRKSSIVDVDEFNLGFVIQICQFTHKAHVKPFGNDQARWMDIESLNVVDAPCIRRQAARRWGVVAIT